MYAAFLYCLLHATILPIYLVLNLVICFFFFFEGSQTKSRLLLSAIDTRIDNYDLMKIHSSLWFTTYNISFVDFCEVIIVHVIVHLNHQNYRIFNIGTGMSDVSQIADNPLSPSSFLKSEVIAYEQNVIVYDTYMYPAYIFRNIKRSLFT